MELLRGFLWIFPVCIIVFFFFVVVVFLVACRRGIPTFFFLGVCIFSAVL
jgi:hypothetical protein